mgnify:CR=1 FL=1
MKKSIKVAAGIVGMFSAITAVGLYGHNINTTCVPGNQDYEAGTGICSSKNSRTAMAEANRKKQKRLEKVKNEEAAKFKVTRTSIAMLALDCETKQIRPFLKDPKSFRELSHAHKETNDMIYVQVNYTATNGFGGRVQNSKVCKYTL